MSVSPSLEKLCEPILQMSALLRIKAIELILHSLEEDKGDGSNEEYSMKDVFAAWDSEESPEETARKIREARCFDRVREIL